MVDLILLVLTIKIWPLKIIPDLTYNDEGMDICANTYDGEMVVFNNDAEAVALFALLKGGNFFCIYYIEI
jgi:hypothetical protein